MAKKTEIDCKNCNNNLGEMCNFIHKLATILILDIQLYDTAKKQMIENNFEVPEQIDLKPNFWPLSPVITSGVNSM